MTDAKPFSDEELEVIREFNQPSEQTPCKTMTEASMIYSEEKRKAYIRRFFDTIAADRKRIERLRGLLDRTVNTAAELKKAVLPSFVISGDLIDDIRQALGKE